MILSYGNSRIRVAAGEHSLSNNDGTEQFRTVVQQLRHPDYSDNSYPINDIALIEVRTRRKPLESA